MNLRVAHAPHERLGSVLGPFILVIELSRVPDRLIHHLRSSHGVRRRAWAERLKRAALGIRHVASVIRAVEILAIPAAISH